MTTKTHTLMANRVKPPVTVVKRDGRLANFERDKVVAAVRRCMTRGLGRPDSEAEPVAESVARAVVGILSRGEDSVGVEDIQRLVIQQLWALGHFDAAEHYTLYREERRKERESAATDPEVEPRIAEDAAHFPSPLQYFQFVDKYARWREADRRRETWSECCDRVMGFFRTRPQLASKLTEGEWGLLREAMFRREASPAMRIVQMAGPALERCNTGAFNCCYVACDDLAMFPEALYLLMQGCGVGFSVESEYVDCLPRVKKQKGSPPQGYKVKDSTEGWCDAVRDGMAAWVGGADVEFDLSEVRPEGARLRIKGGRASGPGPLKNLLSFARSVILKRQGRRLTPRDCHDILCVLGKAGQLGGVRRASEISLSDLDDVDIRDGKHGNWWETSPWLDMANNSAVYEERPDALTFMDEWAALARSGSGERGIFNRMSARLCSPKRRKREKFGTNPCGEILLRSGEMCNLSIGVARPEDTPVTLEEKVTLAAIFGTLQSTLTDFTYVRPLWAVNCSEERLLGVDVNGQMDCPILRPGAAGRSELLRYLRDVAVRTNAEWASRLGVNPSAAVTCVKPSGNSAAFFGCSSGMHARWSKYQVRRVRVSRFGPMAKLLVAEGVPHAQDPLNESLLVFDFLPEPAPDGTPTRHDLTALEQFRNWLDWKENYTEHNPSCTIYVGSDEWLSLGAAVYENFDKVGGLTFLPRDGGTYALAPNEELTEEEYLRRKAAFPKINWAKLQRFELEDSTDQRAEVACAGGACEL